MKINFITGELAPDGKWNVRHVWHKGRRIRSQGTYIPAGCGEIEYKENKEIKRTYKENHITVVKQPNVLKTAFILIHELLHWKVKKFRITWEYLQTGTNEIEAEDLDDAKAKAPESVTDFGDPEEFTQDVTWNTGWEVKSIEEVK